MAYVPNRKGIKELSQRFPFYNRTMMTDDIANDILGFDHALTPWNPANIPGGAGNWSASIGAGAVVDTTTIPHFLYMFGNNGALSYLQWTNAAAKTLLYSNVSIGVRNPFPAQGLIFEIRCWEAQAPGAATKYVATRWWSDPTTNNQSGIRFGWWYGTGVTFAWNNGTGMDAYTMPWPLGDQFNCFMQTIATPAFYGSMSRSEGAPAYDNSHVAAGTIASFKTVRFYMPANVYFKVVLDDVQIA
jgi:hypothetical protein